MQLIKSRADKQQKSRSKRVISIDPRDIATRIMSSGVTPLDVLSVSMRKYFDEAVSASVKLNTVETEEAMEQVKLEIRQATKDACDLAKDLAPYLHPKLQNITMDVIQTDTTSSGLLSADELRGYIRGRTIEHVS